MWRRPPDTAVTVLKDSKEKIARQVSIYQEIRNNLQPIILFICFNNQCCWVFVLSQERHRVLSRFNTCKHLFHRCWYNDIQS